MIKTNRKAALGFIFITLLIDVTGFGIIIPVLPDLIRQMTGGDLSDASQYGGWLMFAFASMQFLFSPVVGNLSDKFGRRSVLLVSLFGFGCDYLILATAQNIFWLFIGRILAGITGASFTTASAYIADVSPPEKRTQNFGMIGAAFGLGFIIGPMLGGFLGEYNTRLPFYVAAGLAFANMLYGFFILPESLPAERRRNFHWKRANPVGTMVQLKKFPVVAALLLPLVCIYVAAHAVQSTWTYFTMEEFQWTKLMVGISLGVVGILVAFVQGFLIRIVVPRLGQKKSVYVGLLMYTIGFFLFAVASQGWMMFVFLVPYCLGGFAGPALQSIMSREVPPDQQGELQGGLTSLMSATAIVGPPLMTNIFSYFTAPENPHFAGAAFLLGAFLSVLSILFAMRALKHYHEPPSPQISDTAPPVIPQGDGPADVVL